jgi:hypothetical protein
MGEVPSPSDELGFAIGSQEVTTAQLNNYLAAIDNRSARVVTGTAATSVQGRPLRYAIIGREGNVTPAGLAGIREAARKLMDPTTTAESAEALATSTPAILWVTGNVHGDEESGADAALRVVYELADRKDCVVTRILDNAIVVVLPIQNPDGREADTRRNAYGFDMNRDWFARTQPETDGKLELLRQYPPVLYIDAHEFGGNHYFFPPNADPVYHEVPGRPFNWINGIYSASIAEEMNNQKIPFFNGAPYDLYAAEYGDTVPTLAFHAAGMTFEKYNGDSIDTRVYQQFVAMWTSLFAGASQKQRILREWHSSYVDAKAQGVAGALEPNGIYLDGKALLQEVPNLLVRHYFFLDEPGRSRELAQLMRRLQRMDVKVWRLKQPLSVPDFRAYGSAPDGVTLPAGTYWVPMAQAQKHWIQAMFSRLTPRSCRHSRHPSRRDRLLGRPGSDYLRCPAAPLLSSLRARSVTCSRASGVFPSLMSALTRSRQASRALTFCSFPTATSMTVCRPSVRRAERRSPRGSRQAADTSVISAARSLPPVWESPR